MEMILAVFIAVAGWIINHILSLRAQKKAFINQIINNARVEISHSINNYIDWLNELVQHNTKLLALTEFPCGRKIAEKDYSSYIEDLRKTIQKVFLDPDFITKLGEYETLLPEIKKIRSYLRKKHIDLFLNLDSNTSKATGFGLDYEGLVKIVDNMKFELVGAQQVAVRDFLVCLQNITLGKITKNQQEFTVYPMTKHPRIILDRKGNLKIVEYGQPDYPESEEMELSNIYKLKNS